MRFSFSDINKDEVIILFFVMDVEIQLKCSRCNRHFDVSSKCC